MDVVGLRDDHARAFVLLLVDWTVGELWLPLFLANPMYVRARRVQQQDTILLRVEEG